MLRAGAERIRIVLDNLSIHSASALHETFPAPEAHRIMRRLEFHFTPKHASWLNMVETEIGVLRCQCLDRRIADRKTLEAEIIASEPRRQYHWRTHQMARRCSPRSNAV